MGLKIFETGFFLSVRDRTLSEHAFQAPQRRTSVQMSTFGGGPSKAQNSSGEGTHTLLKNQLFKLRVPKPRNEKAMDLHKIVTQKTDFH